ncbi:MAG: AraC family transcriptional regulator [Phycisphaerae bacterium]
MNNAFFNEDDMSLLLACPKWRLISSVNSDIPPVKPDNKYLEWITRNSDIHQHREVMLVLSGSSYFTLDGVTYQSRPGTIVLIDANEKHDLYYPPFCGNIKHLWFKIVNKTILTGTPYCKTNIKSHDLNDFKYTFDGYNYTGLSFINAWGELSANEQLDKKFMRTLVKHAFAGLVLELCKAGYYKSLGMDARQTELHHRTVINVIVEHIRETDGRNLNLARLAYIAGYSKFHFAKIFKTVTGSSVLGFINSCRYEKYHELSAKGKNKKQISGELGFSSPAAFSRWLKNAR